MRAIKTFDINRGYAFSTYATPWIKQGMGRYFENNRSPIRFPNYLIQLNRTYNKLKSDNPEKDDMFFVRLIARNLSLSQGKGVSPQTVLWAIRLNEQTMFSNIDNPENKDVLVSMVDPMDMISNQIDYEKLMKVLTYREKYIIFERANGLSLQLISDELNISRERVRQIEQVAIRKVRAVVRLKDKGYLFNDNKGRKNANHRTKKAL